jgi:hypothetical protein
MRISDLLKGNNHGKLIDNDLRQIKDPPKTTDKPRNDLLRDYQAYLMSSFEHFKKTKEILHNSHHSYDYLIYISQIKFDVDTREKIKLNATNSWIKKISESKNKIIKDNFEYLKSDVFFKTSKTFEAMLRNEAIKVFFTELINNNQNLEQLISAK